MEIGEYIRIYGRGEKVFEYNAPHLEIDGDYTFDTCEFSNARVIKWKGTFTARSLHLNDIVDMHRIQADIQVKCLRITLEGKTITMYTYHGNVMPKKGRVSVYLGYYSTTCIGDFSEPCPREEYKNVYNVARFIHNRNCI